MGSNPTESMFAPPDIVPLKWGTAKGWDSNEQMHQPGKPRLGRVRRPRPSYTPGRFDDDRMYV